MSIIAHCYQCSVCRAPAVWHDSWMLFKMLRLLSNVTQGHVLVPRSNALHHIAIVSKSTDIFTNLTLEDWLYNHEDFTKKSVLLLWRNGPSVVIGKHQNPWMECNVKLISEYGINLVRRKSGGGTVYHDMGNLNISVLTSRKCYDRRKNLELVIEAVTSRWDISLEINKRHDILLDGMYKVYIYICYYWSYLCQGMWFRIWEDNIWMAHAQDDICLHLNDSLLKFI